MLPAVRCPIPPHLPALSILTQHASCQTQPNCAGFYAGYGEQYNQDRCILLLAATCAPADVLFEFTAPRNYQGPQDFGYVVGNGACGRVQYDGGRYDY